MNEDGTMARLPELKEFAETSQSENDYGRRSRPVSHQQRDAGASARLKLTCRQFMDASARSLMKTSSTATCTWQWLWATCETEEPVLVRVHTENVTCDMFGSLIDDTGFQLHTALEKIAAAGQGVVLYLRQREHSLDLVNQLRTYAVMQEQKCQQT